MKTITKYNNNQHFSELLIFVTLFFLSFISSCLPPYAFLKSTALSCNLIADWVSDAHYLSGFDQDSKPGHARIIWSIHEGMMKCPAILSTPKRAGPLKAETVLHQNGKDAPATCQAIQTGPWSKKETWGGRIPPAFPDDVSIPAGVTVTVDIPASCRNLSIQNEGMLNVAGKDTLQVYGNWINDGIFESGKNGVVEFKGNSASSIEGQTTFEEFIVTKDSLMIPLNIKGKVTISSGGSLNLNSGRMVVCQEGVLLCEFNKKTTIPKNAGLEVDGGTLSTGRFSVTNNGLIRIHSGKASFGTHSGNSIHNQLSGAFIVSGGKVKIAGRLENTARGTIDQLNLPSGIHISGGEITLNTAGNGLSHVGSLNVTSNGTFNFSGGTIIFQNSSTASTPLDISLSEGYGSKTTAGGIFQFGNDLTPAKTTFIIAAEVYLSHIAVLSDVTLQLEKNLMITEKIDFTNPSYLKLNGNALSFNIQALGIYMLPLIETSGEAIPVTIEITEGIFSADASLTIQTFGEKHPENFKQENYLNRYWKLDFQGVTHPVYTIKAQFTDTDIIGNNNNFCVYQYRENSWIPVASTRLEENTFSFRGTGEQMEFSAFAETVVTLSADPSAPVCAESPVALSSEVSEGTIQSCTWTSIPPGTYPSSSRITVWPDTSTTYILSITNENGVTQCDSLSIIVLPSMVPSVHITGYPGDSICEGTMVTFTANSTNAGLSPSYQWNLNGKEVVGEINPAFKCGSLKNKDKITVKVTSDAPCPATSSSNPITMTILPLPVAALSAESPIFRGAAPIIKFSATPQTLITYRIDEGPEKIIKIDESGLATLRTKPIYSNTIFKLICVKYSHIPGCEAFLSDSVIIAICDTIPLSLAFSPFEPLCRNTIPPSLPKHDLNGIPGTWSPDTISTILPVSSFFVFTPDDPMYIALKDTFPIEIIENIPPQALNDSTSTIENEPVHIHVLQNDSDQDGEIDATSLAIVDAPANGNARTEITGSVITYIPDNDFFGTDRFTYRICDNGIPCQSLCDTAEVILVVNRVNHPPVAQNDSFSIRCDPLFEYLLHNDFDPDGDEIKIITQPIKNVQHGDLTIAEDGSFTYFPHNGFAGTDSFIYRICDNQLPASCDEAVVWIDVLPNGDCDDVSADDELPLHTILKIPEGFSPNGDGIHDFFQISGIAQYPDAKIKIFDRAGNKLFEKQHYGNLSYWGNSQNAWWWGSSNHPSTAGRGTLPAGIYIYVLETTDGEVFTGAIMIAY
ncbi:MAG: Ig-like domain-containing protein [Mariniphaga sp.]|nr:Ig-like domain-containing protein [Mariniphaga sp.]